MTSANLSFSEKLKNHKTYINRTLWTYLIALPFLAAYMILGVIMLVSRSINYAAVYHQSAEVLKLEKLKAVTRILGMEQIGWLIVIGIAVMFAIQSFSYVFSQSQMDFYYSQPNTRRGRIYRNYRNSMSTFAFMYVGLEIIAVIIAAAMGAVNGYSLLMILIETVRSFILFFTFYNITFLAVMLSGSLPIAIILTGCFTFVSMMIAGEISLLKEIFYATYSVYDSAHVHLSPFYDRFAANTAIYSYIENTKDYFNMPSISEMVSLIVPQEADLLVTGLIAFVFALIFARMRKTEWSGKSIALRPFRWIIKVVVCVIAGLGSGFVVYVIYSSVWNEKLFAMMCAIMLLATLITGCIVEVVLEGNIRRFFKGLPQTIMAMALVLLAFVILRGDLLGYDSYIPAAEKIESCAIVDGIYDYNYYTYSMNSDAELTSMEITDVENFLKLAKVGMPNRKALVKANQDRSYRDLGYNITILYRLKSGREIYRTITVPYDEVDDALAAIVDSKEYKTGHFKVFDDDDIREDDRIAYNHELRYSSAGDTRDTKNFNYADFSEAIRKDILENYNFDHVKNNRPIGSIEYYSNSERYVGMDISVYENFTNTIAYLKNCDIYIDSELDLSDIKEVVVTNYYPGYDLENDSIDDIIEMVDSKIMTYDDQDSISKILSASVCSDYYNPWQNYDSTYNGQYNIEIYTNSGSRATVPAYYTFLKGQVPDFVKADTN